MVGEKSKEKRVVPAWKEAFLHSNAWYAVRAFVIFRDKGICQYCKRYILEGYIHVHHKVPLTEANVNDPEISLNPKLLISVHSKCHNSIEPRTGEKGKDIITDDELNIDYSKRGAG